MRCIFPIYQVFQIKMTSVFQLFLLLKQEGGLKVCSMSSWGSGTNTCSKICPYRKKSAPVRQCTTHLPGILHCGMLLTTAFRVRVSKFYEWQQMYWLDYGPALPLFPKTLSTPFWYGEASSTLLCFITAYHLPAYLSISDCAKPALLLSRFTLTYSRARFSLT